MNRRLALVIGNTEYADPGLRQLVAPGNDAQDFARVLADSALCAFDDVKLAINQTSTAVVEAIDEFFDARKPDDLLVLYFSGHGIRDEFGALYLAFKNTMRTRLRASAIKADYIREAMDQSRSKRQVLILDCCNSGAFPQGTKAEIGGPMGLVTTFQGYGRFILMASDATQFAWEGDQVIGNTQNSLFTHFLVKGLEGDADSDGDGKITVDDLYDYAYEQISRVTEKQTPTKAAAKVEGEFVLRRITRLEDIRPISLPADLLDEVDDPRPYVREAAVQKLVRILQGRNLGLARSAMVALEKIVADENTTRRVAEEARRALDLFLKQREAETLQGPSAIQPPGDVASTSALDSSVQPPQAPARGSISSAGAPLPGPAEEPAKDQTVFVKLAPAAPPADVPVSVPIAPAGTPPQTLPARRIPGGWVGGGIALVLICACGIFAATKVLPSIMVINTPGPDATEAPVIDTQAPPTGVPAAGLPSPTAPSLPTAPASQSTAVPNTGIAAPRIGTRDESLAAWNAGVPSLRDKAVEKYSASDNASPTTLPYTVRLGRSDQVRWEWFWCSISPAILEQNLENITLTFTLGGEDVTSSVIHADFTNDGGWYCRTFFISLRDWNRGSYHIVTTARILHTVNDGSSDYIAGDYIDDYTVTVP